MKSLQWVVLLTVLKHLLMFQVKQDLWLVVYKFRKFSLHQLPYHHLLDLSRVAARYSLKRLTVVNQANPPIKGNPMERTAAFHQVLYRVKPTLQEQALPIPPIQGQIHPTSQQVGQVNLHHQAPQTHNILLGHHPVVLAPQAPLPLKD